MSEEKKSFLEEYFGPLYHEMSDEELETLVITGKLAREAGEAAGKPKKKKATVPAVPNFSMDEFE